MAARRQWGALMALLIARCAVAPPSARAQGARGGLRGVVLDADYLTPVPQAVVRLLEAAREQVTANDGHFSIPDLAPGAYTLTVTKPGFARHVQTGIAVVPGSMADVTIRLRAEVTEMEEFVVRELELQETATEAGLLELRQASLTLQDSVSREMISRAGASDVAGALRLVVGATVVEGKYASVRGLSDRYVGAAVNGIRVPSADPKRRAVHLDVFPAGTIDSITVSKTFTPDLPGDYTGGGINIRTLSLPSEPFLKAGVSREVNRRYTGKEGFVTYEGAGINRWGRHRGARDMPEGLADMEAKGLTDASLPSLHEPPIPGHRRSDSERYSEYDRLTRSLAPAMGTKRTRVPDANHSYDISGGGRIGLGGEWDIGAVGALAYSKKFTLQPMEEIQYVAPPLDMPTAGVRDEVQRDVGGEELKWSELVSIGLAKESVHDIRLVGLRNRAVSDRASIATGQLGEGLWAQRQGIQYVERSVDVLQMSGEHRFERFGATDERAWDLSWHVARNRVEQEEPDARFFRNVIQARPGGQYEYQARPDGSSGADVDVSTRIWRNTLEQNSIYGVQAGFPLRWNVPDYDASFMGFGRREDAWTTGEIWLRMGFVRDWTRRNYRQDAYYYVFADQRPPTYTGPVRSDFPPGSAGRRAFEAARAAWFASSTGRQYQAAFEDMRQDAAKRTFVTNTPNALWTDVFSHPDRIGLGRYTDSMLWYIQPRPFDVGYDGDQVFRSGFWMLELPIAQQIKLIGGARLEVTQMRIEPFSDTELTQPERAFLVPVRNYVTNAQGKVQYTWYITGVPREKARTKIEDSSWLRSMGLLWEITPRMNLRLTWAQTIARPTFLEIAPVITHDFIEGETSVGNNELKLSRIVNRDLRWEWFPTADEMLAISIFEKRLTDPIEREAFTYLNDDYLLAVNYPEGYVQGVEVEGRARLDFMPDPFKPLSVGLNYTKIDARVTVPENIAEGLDGYGLRRDRREMEGQPAFLFNFNLTYDIERWGTAFGWFYNIRGDLLKAGAAVGERGATPDIFVKKFANVGLSLSQKIGRHAKLTFRAHNVLDPPVTEVYRKPDGEEIPRRKYREGVRYSLGLSMEW